MRNFLFDLIQHSQDLGFLSTVKISATPEATNIQSLAEDKSVIMTGETLEPIQEFSGVFGMTQLNKLKFLLGGSEYKQDAKISLLKTKKDDPDVPTGLRFENKDCDFKNDFRFMNTEIINEKLKNVKFKGANWNITTSPSLPAIQRFAFQASVNSEHPTFLAKTNGSDLIFVFGDDASHGGEFVFSHDIEGSLTRGWLWPVSQLLAILKLAETDNAILKISDEGVIMLSLESTIAKYDYIIPAKAT